MLIVLLRIKYKRDYKYFCSNVSIFIADQYFTDCMMFCQVALLDVDICGPSIPRVMGLEGEQVSRIVRSFSWSTQTLWI